MSTVHDFATSANHDAAPWWSTVYGRAFAGYQTHEIVTDKASQKAGIDHRVHLSGGAQILVDCKTRDRWYDDILIEVWSDKQRSIPGWARKPLRCHYVAYAFPKQEVAFLLPFHILRRTYERNKEQWAKDGLRVVPSENTDYTTISVAVPWKRLCTEVAEAMLVYFDPELEPFK